MITSLDNKKVKQWMKYHQQKYREQDEVFLVEGEHLIQEAYKHQHLKELFIQEGVDFKLDNIKTSIATSKVMKKLSKVQSAQTMIGLCTLPKLPINANHRIFLCDNIQDPGNLGTIIRTALAFSFDAIYCSKDTVDFTNDKVIRATQGALFQIPIKVVDIKKTMLSLKKQGVHVVSCALDENATSFIKPLSKMAFVLGNEGNGISQDIIALSDQTYKIDIQHIDSLNVAITAGIVAHQFKGSDVQ